jgi:hypothetical protein
MRLTVDPSKAIALLSSIPHATCHAGIQTRWRVDGNSNATAESVLWLYCWAKTGQGSDSARLVSTEVFDQIFPVSFAQFDKCLNDHEWARRNRYTETAQKNVEQELAGRLRACSLSV